MVSAMQLIQLQEEARGQPHWLPYLNNAKHAHSPSRPWFFAHGKDSSSCLGCWSECPHGKFSVEREVLPHVELSSISSSLPPFPLQFFLFATTTSLKMLGKWLPQRLLGEKGHTLWTGWISFQNKWNKTDLAKTALGIGKPGKEGNYSTPLYGVFQAQCHRTSFRFEEVL